MKPSWDFAPEWANYMAKNDDEQWYWYEYQPTCYSGRWYSTSGRSQIAGRGEELSLEKRPTKE